MSVIDTTPWREIGYYFHQVRPSLVSYLISLQSICGLFVILGARPHGEHCKCDYNIKTDVSGIGGICSLCSSCGLCSSGMLTPRRFVVGCRRFGSQLLPELCNISVRLGPHQCRDESLKRWMDCSGVGQRPSMHWSDHVALCTVEW